MSFDVETLSRIQFALTVMFHYLFPPLTIGLGWLMVICEGLYLKTKDKIYEDIARFWTRIFAINFAMGVATGIVMEFQFGTNWAAYSKFVGDVFGSALAAEGIFAFFLESGFLAVLVFGWDRVSPKMHFFSTVMVAIGATFSAIWIVVANSWQQTPAGFHLVGEGMNVRAEITNFWEMVFNPSSMHRLNHVLIGSLMAGSFFILSISSYYILRGKFIIHAKRSILISLIVAVIASAAAPISGHFQAVKVSETQPAKLAAFEGHFQTTEGGAPLWLFGIPVEDKQEVNYGIPIPGMLSFLIHGDFSTPVPGLDQYDRNDWPPIQLTFQSYHIMVTCGMIAMMLTLIGMYYLKKGTFYEQKWLLWLFVFSVCLPYFANQTGWIAAEVGRQPWIVYGLLRTSEAYSKSITSMQVFGSIFMFCILYSMLFIIWLYVLNDKIQKGPETTSEPSQNTGFLETAVLRADHRAQSSNPNGK